MSTRSYLSIGDVLTLLRQEFPDVTISKIRFLESQGLVNPERTPSGYRKFYEHDVERLRWVLRQQREHFLPLKVIKDRLDDDAPEPGSGPSRRAAAVSSSASTSKAGARAHADVGNGPQPTEDRRTEEPVLVGHRSSTDRAPTNATTSALETHGPGDPLPALAGDGPTLPGIESGLRTPAPRVREARGAVVAPPGATPTPGPVSGRTSGHAPQPTSDAEETTAAAAAVPPASPSAAAAPPAPGGPGGPGGKPTSPGPAAPVGSPSPAPGTANRRPAAPVDLSGTPPPKGGAAKPAPAAARPVPGAAGSTSNETPEDGHRTRTKSDSGTASLDLNGPSLSADELAAACGLEVAVLRELQEYGLLGSSSVAGVEYFDEEALAVANLAAGFARFGIEPRHLRLYKNAADREAGFVEQIVLPLVRQRNPEARARAHETADELTRLGQQLRASLLRTALGSLLNG
jgi:DNA-binding transcriptional MerR regulator